MFRIDDLKDTLKFNFNLIEIVYQGDDEEGSYFVAMDSQKSFIEIRVLQEEYKNVNIQKRGLGEQGWKDCGKIELKKLHSYTTN